MRSTFIMAILTMATSAIFAQKGFMVTYRVGERDFEGYYADAGKDKPFILLVHDWDGLNDYEMKRAEMLRSLGYSVFAADLFGKGVHPKTLDEKKRLTGELYADRSRMRELLLGALDAAHKQGADVSDGVALGYCFGGAAVLELARSGAALKGFVVFHGGLETPQGEDYKKVKGKVLVLHGAADKAVPVEQFAECAKAMEAAGVSHEMILYGGADHAFTVFGGERYDKQADTASWKEATAFLKGIFGR